MTVPRERRKQFDLIAKAETALLSWARREEIPLEHVEFIVPFVETDFSLAAVHFYRDRADVFRCEADGTSGRVSQRFKEALRDAGYPENWIVLVRDKFASKQEVDEQYQGNYYHYVR